MRSILILLPLSENGCEMLLLILRATFCALATVARFLSTIANSSPPIRATMSPSLTSLPKPFGGDHQHLVADRVAETVVDVLKAADVEEKYLKGFRRVVDDIRRSASRSISPKCLRFGKTGQRIVKRRMLKILLALPQRIIRTLFHLERPPKLFCVSFCFESSSSFRFCFLSLGHFGLIDCLTYVTNQLPVVDIRDGHRQKRNCSRSNV